MAQTNTELSVIFQQMADVLEILASNRFRVIAFQKAARVLSELATDVSDMKPEALTEIDGICKGVTDRIREFLDTGGMAEHEDLMAQVPGGVVDLLDIPGLGPKTVAVLWKQASVTDMHMLTTALDSGQLEKLPGFGKKKIQNIRKNLAFAAEATKRVRLGDAMPLGQWFVEELRSLEAVHQVTYAGSLRRGRETIGDIDLLVAATTGSRFAQQISDAFVKLEPVAEVISKGLTKTSIRTTQGLQVDLRIVEFDSFGAAVMYFTGSKAHNVAMRERAIAFEFKLNEYGLDRQDSGERVAGRTEQDVFQALNLQWIPPELREDRGEIALAERNELPRLIEMADIGAELHAHTKASDGRWSIRELALCAAERGFHTVAVTDHSKGQVQANGLSGQRLEKHIEAIHDVAIELKDTITVLAGSEVDILTDGTLDYPDSLLEQLDIVVASPHAALSQESGKCTKRFLKAIDHPSVTIIGHLTGRLINRREGLSPDLNQVLQAAADRGIAMEINANHYRLDLRDTHVRAARDAGVKLAINTDAHGPADLDELSYGILTARRAGASKQDVVNCLSKESLLTWIESTRKGTSPY